MIFSREYHERFSESRYYPLSLGECILFDDYRTWSFRQNASLT